MALYLRAPQLTTAATGSSTASSTSMNRELKRVPERFVSHWGQAMFGLLPLYAFYLKLVYLSRRMRWSEHLVFALHLHSFWFVMLGLQLFNVEFFKTTAMCRSPCRSFRMSEAAG